MTLPPIVCTTVCGGWFAGYIGRNAVSVVPTPAAFGEGAVGGCGIVTPKPRLGWAGLAVVSHVRSRGGRLFSRGGRLVLINSNMKQYVLPHHTERPTAAPARRIIIADMPMAFVSLMAAVPSNPVSHPRLERESPGVIRLAWCQGILSTRYLYSIIPALLQWCII